MKSLRSMKKAKVSQKKKRQSADPLDYLIEGLKNEVWGQIKITKSIIKKTRRVWVLYPKTTPTRPYDVTESYKISAAYMREYKDFNRHEFIELTPEVKERLGIL